MNPELLLTFFILCSTIPTTSKTPIQKSDFTLSTSRLLSQKIIDQENKKVQRAIKHKTSFQLYHFSLQPNSKQVEFYMDPITEQQIQGHVSIMWKQKNAFLLPNVLLSQKIKLEIYQNENRILIKSFYTKAAFHFYGEQDKLYRIKISHKNQQPLVKKLVTLHIENFFQSFEENEDKEVKQKKKKLKLKKNNNKYLLDEEQSEASQKDEIDGDQQDKITKNNQIVDVEIQRFELWMVSERLRQFLIEMKLLINEAETKHLVEYTVQKFIQNSVEIYWQYELFQCLVVIFCTVVEIILVNRLLHSNKILI